MRRTGPLSLLLAFLAALALAGCGTGGDNAPYGPQRPAATPAAKPAAVAQVDPARVHPIRVSVPSIGADSDLLPLGLNPDRTLATPSVNDPLQAAWYRGSPVPGNIGPAVVLGHINGGGHPGVFAHLADLRHGALVDIDRSDGTTAEFTVRRVDVVDKAQFPTKSTYSDTGNSQLRLISCGGDLDASAHSYEGQVIAYADLTGAHRT